MKNLIETHKDGSTLEATLYRTFNLWAKHLLEDRLDGDITNLRIDLSQCHLIDSEGVIFLHQWHQSDKKLQIVDPPAVLFDILDILKLRKTWDMETIITS